MKKLNKIDKTVVNSLVKGVSEKACKNVLV